MIYDVPSDEIIAELTEYRGRTTAPPNWSPDGSKLLMVKEAGLVYDENNDQHEEFFIITNDGEVEQITHFNDSFAQSRIGYFDWSPNGGYVAFWFQNKAITYDEYLSILDMETQEVVTYCLTHDKRQGYAPPPIWSPDGNSIIIKRVRYPDPDDVNSKVREIFLINLNQGFAAKLGEAMNPLGWLINKPIE
jgi:Tol biopolymer transport system component